MSKQLLQDELAAGLDDQLRETHVGFRKNKAHPSHDDYMNQEKITGRNLFLVFFELI